SVTTALSVLEKEKPDLVLVDIFLQGEGTGIDLGKVINTRNIPFVYFSTNSHEQKLEAAKRTLPYGFMAKPFRSKDVLIMLDVALYLHENRPPERSVDNPKRSESAALPSEFSELIGKSDKFVEVLKEAGHVGPRETSVLILGESGT